MADRPDLRRGTTLSETSPETIAAELGNAKALDLVRSGMDRPYRFVSVKTGDAKYAAKPWDWVRADASNGPMTVLLPNPTDREVAGKQIVVAGVGRRSHPVVLLPTKGLIDDSASAITAGPSGSLTVQSDGSQWLILARGPGNPRERILDTAYDPVGLWNSHLGAAIGFADYSGNGNNLTLQTGTSRYVSASPTLGCVMLDGVTSWGVGSYQAELGLTGAMSAMALVFMLELPGAGSKGTIFNHFAAGEAAAQNNLYELASLPTSGARYFHEQGAGVDVTFDSTAWLPKGQVALMGFTRTAGGVVQHFYNGRSYGAASGVLTMPTGGTDGQFRIGASTAGFHGLVPSVAIYNRVLTAAEWVERYNYLLGFKYGFIA